MAEVVHDLFFREPEFFTGINFINIGNVLQRLPCRRDMSGHDQPCLTVWGNKQDQQHAGF